MSASAALPATAEPPRILLVDDDPVMCGILAETIAGAGFAAECFPGVSDCLVRLDRSDAPPPSAIVLDIFMPGGDGFDLMRELAARKCRTPLVVITGADPEYLTVASEFGRAWGLSLLGVVEKPVRRERLCALLADLPPVAAAEASPAVVLVVDDDHDVRTIVGQMFRHAGFGVVEATTGPEALDILREPRRIDVLFTDLDMAPMDGIALALAAEKLRPRLRIVYTSGKIDEPPIARSLFLAKPYRPAELIKVMAAALAR